MRRLLAASAIAIVLVGTGSGSASAQGWTAQLNISPLPSPFLSDWEVDPTVAEIVVTNQTATAAEVTFHFSLTRNGATVVRGVTDPHTVSPGAPRVFNATTDFGGRVDWDRSLQDLVARTGRFPEGEYEGCVTLAGAGGVVLVDKQCHRFTLQYPDPPYLVFPANGDTIHSQDPIFEWQPVQLPPGADARLGYVLQVAEVRTGTGQLPATALESNILHYVQPNLVQTSHQYPVGALPLVSGRTYAWRVQALDGDGRPVATNQGRSEIWTFVYREPQVEVTRTIARIELSARRDTLRYAGDTSRYEAVAFDANNVEILDAKIAWRSLDTTIVRVDSNGLVRGVARGATRVVATSGSIADTMSSVLSASSTVALSFEMYDAAASAPSLLELIKSGSFAEIAPRLSEMVASGELVIPIPRLAALQRRGGSDGNGADDSAVRGAGPSADQAGARVGQREICGVGANASAGVAHDTERKIWAVRLQRVAWQDVTAECIGAPETGGEAPTDDATQRDSLMLGGVFVVSWAHPGIPRVSLVIKGMGLVPLPMFGTEAQSRFLVVNFTNSATLSDSTLPRDFAGFFGTEEIDAGPGITFQAKRKCVDFSTTVCKVVEWANKDDPIITTTVFAGLTASETSIGATTTGKVDVGTSFARGVSWLSTLPPKRVDIDPLGLHFDVEFGFQVSLQDSVTYTDSLQRQAVVRQAGKDDNWSIGISPTVAITWAGPTGREWEFSGQVGLEWDPSEATLANASWLKPAIVATGQLPVVWQVTWLRIGNPQVVTSWKVGEKLTVAISGTWGLGGWDSTRANAVGVSETGGGAVVDPGHAGLGGANAFEELGRGAITFEFTPLTTAAARRDDATNAVTKLHRAVLDARARVDSLRKADILQPDGRAHAAVPASKRRQYDEAQKQLEYLERDLKAKRRDRDQAIEAVKDGRTLGCWKQSGPGTLKCVNWSFRASVGNQSLVDLAVLLGRLLGNAAMSARGGGDQ